jgi:predicted Rossmann fold nucleotide-binding protein DprA/Smf involved in DNA uptake
MGSTGINAPWGVSSDGGSTPPTSTKTGGSMNIAIVGSRTRTDKDRVIDCVNKLPKDCTVVSGGCEGVDTWAIEAAKERGMKWKIFFPDLSGANTYYEKCERYYDRNEKVVKNSDFVIAFVASNRKGGTENTIKFAGKHKKLVMIVKEGFESESVG